MLYTIISSSLSSPVFCPPFYSILLLSYQSCDSSVYHITSYIMYHITISCLSPRIDPPQIDIIYHTVIRTCTLDISLRHGQLPLLLDNRHKYSHYSYLLFSPHFAGERVGSQQTGGSIEEEKEKVEQQRDYGHSSRRIQHSPRGKELSHSFTFTALLPSYLPCILCSVYCIQPDDYKLLDQIEASHSSIYLNLLNS